jgi:cytochrome c553
MKQPSVPLRSIACLLAVTAAALAHAGGRLDLRRVEPVRGDAGAGAGKAAVCSACHGPGGISPVPNFPNLAGQSAEYLYYVLVGFRGGVKPDSPMTPVVAALGDADLRDLAAYFAAQPAAEPTGDPTATARGGALYRDGDPARGIPPCRGCHGADAGGHPLAAREPRYRAYPALRGQHAAYLARRLQDFRAGAYRYSSNDEIMTAIAATLDDDAIAQLSGWLQAGAR